MSHATDTLERKRLLETAQEYEEQGYSVIVEPHLEDVPAFLANFRLDMIAFGAEENVVVEVKTRTTLIQSPLQALAQAISQAPGWRLDLVVTNPRGRALMNGADPLTPGEIEARLRAVRGLLLLGQEVAALLLVWSAAEATLRLLARQHQIELRDDSSFLLVKTLFAIGLFPREVYDALDEGAQARTAIVHGFQRPEAQTPLVARLTSVTEDLMSRLLHHALSAVR